MSKRSKRSGKERAAAAAPASSSVGETQEPAQALGGSAAAAPASVPPEEVPPAPATAVTDGVPSAMTAEGSGPQRATYAATVDLLFHSLREGDCVVVVGASLGETIAAPSWSALVSRLAALLREKGDAGGANGHHDLPGELRSLVERGRKLLALSAIERHAGRHRTLEEVQAALTGAEGASASAVMQAIATLPFRAAVTTAQMGPLGKAIADAIGRPLREAEHDQAESLDPKKRFLLWALGRVTRPESLLMTSRDLRRALGAEPAFRALFEEIYRDRTLLLVGFRPDDPDLELLLTRVFPSLPPTEREHFLVIGGQTQLEAEDLLYEHQIRSIEIDDGGQAETHAGLAKFLEELRARCEREGVPLAAQAAARPPRDDVEGWVAELVADPTDVEAQTTVERLEQDLRTRADWGKLIELLLGKVEAIKDGGQRTSTLREVAHLFEKELGDAPRAMTALVAALGEDPTSTELCAEAERLAEEAGLWSDLVAGYAEVAAHVTKEGQPGYFARLGAWYADKLGRTDYAIASYEQARKVDPSAPLTLAALAGLYRKEQRFSDLADVYAAQAANESQDAAARVDALLALGDVADSNLKDFSRAASAYRKALEIEPKNADALAALEALLRRQERWNDLVDVLRARADAELDPTTQVGLRREIGRLLEAQKDGAGAAAAYEAAVAIDPRDVTALRALEHLYDHLGKTEDYLRTLERLSDCAEDDKGRVALYRRMAVEWEERPQGVLRAIEWWERMLSIDPRSDEAYRALERLYRREQQWEQLCDCLSRHAAVVEGAARADLYAQAAQVFERDQADPHRAVESWSNVLGIDGGNVEARKALARLYERIESYDRAVELHVELADLFAGTDKVQAIDHAVRAAEITRDRLGDLAAAEARFLKALAIDPAHLPAMLALVDIYTRRGELLRAAKQRVEAEAATQNRQEKVRLLFEAATVYHDHLDSPERAAELYEKVLALDPEHVEAGERLVELWQRAEKWAQTVPVLEMLLRKSDPEDRPRIARLARDLGRAAEAGQDPEKAARAYRQAAGAAPDEVEPVAALASLAWQRDEGKEAEELYRKLVGVFRSALSEGALVEAQYRLGTLARKRGDLTAAKVAFEAARNVDPAHRPTLLALAELLQEKGDFRALIESRRALLETATPDERARLLEEIGDVYREKLHEKSSAVSAYLEALEARPESQGLLHRLLEIYSEDKQWRRAVDVVKRLVAITPEPSHKAKYYYAAAVICRDEIGPGAADEAIELFGLALDEDPDFHKAFEASEKLMLMKQDFRGLARLYRKMIKRLPPTGKDETRLRLWEALADVCLEKLGERDAGIAALEVVSALKPGDVSRQDLLTHLYIQAGPSYAEKAIAGQQALLRREPDKLSGYRTLRRLYLETRQADKAWCLAGALKFLNAADSADVADWEAGRPTAFVAARRRLTEELWQKDLIHPREERGLSALFALLTPVIAALTAQPLAAVGLRKGAAVDPVKDEQLVAKIFRYVTHTLGVNPPELYYRMESKDPLHIVHVGEKGVVGPALLVGAPHLGKTAEKEMVYEVAKQLAFLRPERYLRYVLPQAGTLAGAVASAMAATGVPWQPATGLPLDRGDVEKLAAHFKRTLPAGGLEQVAALCRKIAQSEKAGDVRAWMDGVDLTASRAAFALTNDFDVAARAVVSETATGSALSAKDRLRELLVYSVSEEYFAVRRHLGFEIGAPG